MGGLFGLSAIDISYVRSKKGGYYYEKHHKVGRINFLHCDSMYF